MGKDCLPRVLGARVTYSRGLCQNEQLRGYRAVIMPLQDCCDPLSGIAGVAVMGDIIGRRDDRLFEIFGVSHMKRGMLTGRVW